MLLYQLFRPLGYLTIKDESKWKIDLLVPLIAAVTLTFFLYSLPIKPVIFGSSGLMSLLVGILQILPGFYLTALAAIATFNRPDMDFLMPKPTPTMSIVRLGRPEDIKLTRRRMLSMLFGYLTFLSFILYFIAIIVQVSAVSLASMLSVEHQLWARNIFMLIYIFLVCQLFTITMFGLYQLSDRMHQPD